ncbi:UNVERIFIED_CONTAM: hypothetical protein Slati_3352800 [Sesamum latifolium]|uniref:Uncharacterized protein n=1 Tax=Sesamum latifolium TaxID=2727402 RepID=A0AAW2UD51_9LAMI
MRDDFNHSNKAISYAEHFTNSRFVESVLDVYWELPPVAGPSLTHQTRYDPARTSAPIVEDGRYRLFQRLGLSRFDTSVFNGYTQMASSACNLNLLISGTIILAVYLRLLRCFSSLVLPKSLRADVLLLSLHVPLLSSAASTQITSRSYSSTFNIIAMKTGPLTVFRGARSVPKRCGVA